LFNFTKYILLIIYLDAKSDYNQKTSQKDPNLNSNAQD